MFYWNWGLMYASRVRGWACLSCLPLLLGLWSWSQAAVT